MIGVTDLKVRRIPFRFDGVEFIWNPQNPAFAVLILCIVQVGPAPVLVPVMIWAWTAWQATPALVLTLLLVPVMLLDNVLKPVLMARGLTTPMLVILTGVIGGTLTHGLIGLFLGRIVLAVFYELVVAWTRLGNEPAP